MDKWKRFIYDGIYFLMRNKKYLVSSVLVVITVLVLVSSDDKAIRLFPKVDKKAEQTVSGEEIPRIEVDLQEEQKVDENPLILNEDKQLNKFIKNYYKALEKADIEKIREYVDVLNDIEVNSIRQKAKAREAHKNIKVYTKKGPEEDSFLAYVYLDLKFKNIKTMAPGIEPFYIKKESDGYVIINSMNSSAEDLQYTNEMESSEDVVELFAKTDDAYREACAKDKELVKMLKENGFEVPDLSKTEPQKNEEADAKVSETGENQEAEASSQTSGENASSETAQVQQEARSQEETRTAEGSQTSSSADTTKSIVGNTYVLTDGIRLRAKKSTKSSLKASGVKDDRVKVVKEYESSAWVKVQLVAAGKSFYGYMKKDVLLENSKLKN